MGRVLRAALVLLALAAGAFAADGAAAQGRIVGRYGDWQIRCDKQVGAPSEECALIQNVEAADRANVALTVIFIRTADKQAQILRVLAPLGVLLPSGLGLSIDDADVGLAGFVRCVASGCIAEVQLDKGLIERLQAGKNATFVIFLTPEEGIGIPISLNGFGEGFAALENPPDETLQTVAPAPPVEAQTENVAPSARYEPASFTAPEADDEDRSFLQRLVEDELFPYVAAAAGAVVVLVALLVALLLRAGRRRRRAEPRATAASAGTAPPVAAPAVAATAPAAPTAGGRGERQAPRLAPDAPQRQVLPERGKTPPAPRAEGTAAVAAPRVRPDAGTAPRRPDRPS